MAGVHRVPAGAARGHAGVSGAVRRRPGRAGGRAAHHAAQVPAAARRGGAAQPGARLGCAPRDFRATSAVAQTFARRPTRMITSVGGEGARAASCGAAVLAMGWGPVAACTCATLRGERASARAPRPGPTRPCEPQARVPARTGGAVRVGCPPLPYTRPRGGAGARTSARWRCRRPRWRRSGAPTSNSSPALRRAPRACWAGDCWMRRGRGTRPRAARCASARRAWPRSRPARCRCRPVRGAREGRGRVQRQPWRGQKGFVMCREVLVRAAVLHPGHCLVHAWEWCSAGNWHHGCK